MVDIFRKQICNYCKNTECEKNEYFEKKIIEIKVDGITIYKCVDYKKDSSKIIPIDPPLPVTAERDYVKYYER